MVLANAPFVPVRPALVGLISLLSGALLWGTEAQAQAKPAEREALSGGEILVRREAVKGVDVPRFRVRAVVEAPPKKVWAVVSDCQNYARRLTGLRASKLLEKKGNIYTCELTAALPFPMSDMTSVSRGVHTEGPGEIYTREWTMIRGDYKRNEGMWRVEPFDGDPSRSLVTYVLLAEGSLGMPDWVKKRIETKSMPELFQALRKAARP